MFCSRPFCFLLQRFFEENRKCELVETQRLQEQERRRQQEKVCRREKYQCSYFSSGLFMFPQERRMKQQKDALVKEKETSEKVAARAFAQSYLSDLVPSVFSTLNQNGFFYDPVERGIHTIYWWL